MSGCTLGCIIMKNCLASLKTDFTNRSSGIKVFRQLSSLDNLGKGLLEADQIQKLCAFFKSFKSEE